MSLKTVKFITWIYVKYNENDGSLTRYLVLEFKHSLHNVSYIYMLFKEFNFFATLESCETRRHYLSIKVNILYSNVNNKKYSYFQRMIKTISLECISINIAQGAHLYGV